SSSRKARSLALFDPDSASRAPCPANARAIADPIPPLAPVTRAVIPVRSNMLMLRIHVSRGGAETRRRIGRTIIVHQPPYAFLHRLAAKVQKQPYGLLHQAQVGQKLLGVNRRKSIHGFDLH